MIYGNFYTLYTSYTVLYKMRRSEDIKELSLCHKLKFSNPYIFAT